MIRALFPIGFAVFALMIGHAALEAGTSILEVEAVEICHRAGGTPETCGDLPR
jgi:hypothetical protein